MTPAIHNIVETLRYVDFYTRILGLEIQGLTAFPAATGQVFLLFKRGGSRQGSRNGSGRQHFAFGMTAPELADSTSRLTASGIVVEGTVDWPAVAASYSSATPTTIWSNW